MSNTNVKDKFISVEFGDSILTPEEGQSLARAAAMSRSILPDGSQGSKQNEAFAEPESK